MRPKIVVHTWDVVNRARPVRKFNYGLKANNKAEAVCSRIYRCIRDVRGALFSAVWKSL